MKVLFYGRLAETIGGEIQMPGSGSVAELREALIREHPAAEATLRNKRSRACIGDTLVSDEHSLAGAETVEFLPPVSGG